MPQTLTGFHEHGQAAGREANQRQLLAIVTSAGGSPQVSYNHHPFYYYVNDHKPGDVYGQDFASLWFVLSPRGGHPQVGQ